MKKGTVEVIFNTLLKMVYVPREAHFLQSISMKELKLENSCRTVDIKIAFNMKP